MRTSYARRSLAVIGAMAAILAGFASPAAAATNPYTPAEACGSSYRVLHSMPVTTNAGATWGRVYLMYSSTTRKNCVVTIKTSFVGTATRTDAAVEARNGDVGWDTGNYKYYAREYVYAPGSCVMYSGYVYSPGQSVAAYAHHEFDFCD